MPTLRKGGSLVAYTWVGKIPDPTDEQFAAALAGRRFRTIENAASEEISFGWVTPADPTGDSVDVDDRVAGPMHWWLRFRTDVKLLPAELVQRHIATAEKARGKRMSARERRELKNDLAEQVLPRILPRSTNTDVLLCLGEGDRVLCARGWL